MKPGAGKAKGSTFERECGVILSRWFSKGEKTDLVTRNVLSGGQFTVSQGKRGQPADLVSPDPEANKFFLRVAVECKHWKDIDIFAFLRGTGLLNVALKKVIKEAAESGRTGWLLISRQNYCPIYVFYPVGLFPIDGKDVEHHTLFKNSVVMVQLDALLKAVSYEEWLADVEAKEAANKIQRIKLIPEEPAECLPLCPE